MKGIYIHVDETASTNSHLAGIAATAAHGTAVFTDKQTAGRGQRGNSWESEPGKNLTMSILLRPERISPSRQFLLSEITALAVARTLSEYTDGISIKWPNDIYYKDLKICGMLIEHSLSDGKITHTIAGIGINVNQPEFRSDAPNPVSLRMITGADFSIREIMEKVCEELLRLYDTLPAEADAVHRSFLSLLYRREGLHRYRSAIRSVATDGCSALEAGTDFEARIADVHSDGMLDLALPDGSIHTFAFKEVAFVLPHMVEGGGLRVES